MELIRSVSTAATVALALVAGVGDALAQSNGICLQLQARLIQIERGNASVVDRSRDYDAPVAKQQSEVNRAMAEARRVGCLGGFLIFQPKPDPKCGRLMATIDRMRANLNRLTAARGQFASDPFSLARERSDILRNLQANRCSGAGPGDLFASRVEQPAPSGGLFATLFGQPRLRTFGDDTFIDSAGFGTYRTLCVRTCDGYYFPISFSTVPGQFSSDAATCQQLCPSAEATLYTHRNPGEDVSAMVSLSGEPYSALPTAFLYRKQFDKACTCGSATAGAAQLTEFSTAGSLDPTSTVTAALAGPPMPHARPAPGEDPETIANRLGSLVAKPVTAAGGENTELAGVTADGRKVRIVGPAFYYAQ